MHSLRLLLPFSSPAILFLAATVSAPAAEVIKPNIGEPLRDAAVTRAPDGTFYLTGTTALPKDEGADFANNDGIRLWTSKDLKDWKDEGVVFSQFSHQGWKDPITQPYFSPERPLGARPVSALTSPRLSVLDGEYFITFSVLGHDVRWARAATAAGPFVRGRIARTKEGKEMTNSDYRGVANPLFQINGPGNGSFFTDADGTTYLLWGPGFLAKLNEKMENVVDGAPAFLLANIAGYPNADWCAGQFAPKAFSLFLKDGKYLLTWSAYTDTAGHRSADSFYAVADKLEGPYSEPQPLLAGSGPVVLFEGEGGNLMASCSVADAPALVPLTFAGGKLAAAAKLDLPTIAAAAKPGKLEMFDYANAKASGKRSEKGGPEIDYTLTPVFADKPGTPEPRKGGNRPVPLFDLPIADVSVCKGGDDAWYLTGTVASKKSDLSDKSDSSDKSDFQNNDGIYLWRSTDLDTWLPLGKVWDIEKDGSPWAKESRIPGDNLLREDFCRGVTAPEIHFLDGTYYLAYSMNGRGTGLLKTKTGKAEGPYEDLGRLTAMGESPSIFADSASGKRYWLWGRGLQIAPLAAAGNALDGQVRDLAAEFVPHKPHGWDYVNRMNWWDVTAPFLFTAIDPISQKPVYALTFSAVTQALHRANRDTMIAIADGLFGPYDAAKRMIPHGGQTSVFAGPKGELFATFWGADPSAVWRDRAGIVPLEWFRHMERPWPRMVQGDFHTRRGWGEIQPIEGIPGARDPYVFAAPDGYFYYSMSDHRHPAFPKSEGGAQFWRAKDIRGPWEHFGMLYTMEEMRDDPNWPPIVDEKTDTASHSAKFTWETEMRHGMDTYWITCWFGGHVWGKDTVWKKQMGALLKSTSGKAEGPYVLHGGAQPRDFTGVFFDEDGSIYGMHGASSAWRMTDDLKDTNHDWPALDGTPFGDRDSRPLGSNGSMEEGFYMSRDCGWDLIKTDGKYVFSGLCNLFGYDGIFSYSEGDIRGPYRYLGVLPGLGNSNAARNSDGKWYVIPQQGGSTAFYTHPLRDHQAAYCYEAVFDWKSKEPTVFPAADTGHLDEAVYRK